MKTCGCGKAWLDTWEGRLEHKQIHGHAPSDTKDGKN